MLFHFQMHTMLLFQNFKLMNASNKKKCLCIVWLTEPINNSVISNCSVRVLRHRCVVYTETHQTQYLLCLYFCICIMYHIYVYISRSFETASALKIHVTLLNWLRNAGFRPHFILVVTIIVLFLYFFAKKRALHMRFVSIYINMLAFGFVAIIGHNMVLPLLLVQQP